MTAVASPPSVQSGPRLGWYPTSNGGQGGLSSPSAEEVSRMFMPRKNLQRTNSSSSLASSASSTSTISAHSQNGNAEQASNNENGSGPVKKKPYRYIWSSSKAEPVSGVTNARSQAVPAPPSGTTASSAMSALHQPPQIVPSQQSLQSQQQNGVRQANGAPPNESPAILVLSPINGTFERKQITVPYFPEVLRVGRQTNAKTVPTPLNGYFDSKVLSRQHAEVWADRSGKVWIRDVKSSNGTFVNGQRLSPENRDSEPHELREQDVLELGIDIVSEDQRSIVHHKVSAKVDHAGIYGHNMNVNVLDLNFGDIDPTSGGGMLPSHLSQPLPHMRGRTGSSGSIASNRSAQSASSTHFNALHQQRQMNYWLSPISIEQVVKKLSSEMKQAKQQFQDLNQTQDFLTSLISQEGSEKERPKASPTDSNGGRLANGRPKAPKLDPMSRFSDPPAPPPQQPLPEKPHALPRSTTSDPIITSPLKRSDTEKPKASSGSPVSRDSSQILSLLEALASAKKELDAQATRVKELEGLLAQERTARENAEERAKGLEDQPSLSGPGPEVEEAFEPPAEVDESAISDENTVVEKAASTPNVSRPQPAVATPVSDSTSEHLQERLDAVMAEMDEMRKQVDKYKHSAERAENDAAESRKTLAEMIESIRRERSEAASTSPQKTRKAELEDRTNERDSLVGQTALDSAPPSTLSPSSPHILGHSQFKEVEGAPTAFAKQRHKNHLLEQSAPYASMLGVVLLGVGIMAYLNGWQKVDK